MLPQTQTSNLKLADPMLPHKMHCPQRAETEVQGPLTAVVQMVNWETITLFLIPVNVGQVMPDPVAEGTMLGWIGFGKEMLPREKFQVDVPNLIFDFTNLYRERGNS